MRIMLAAVLVIFLVVASAEANDKKSMQLIRGVLQVPGTKLFDGTKYVTLNDFMGHYVLVNFWATWCLPCVKEMPSLDRLAVELEKHNFLVVAISQDDGGVSQVKPFLERLQIQHMTVLYDISKKTFRDFALRGLPTSVLISPTGQIISRLEGEAVWDEGVIFHQIKELTGSLRIDAGH